MSRESTRRGVLAAAGVAATGALAGCWGGSSAQDGPLPWHYAETDATLSEELVAVVSDHDVDLELSEADSYLAAAGAVDDGAGGFAVIGADVASMAWSGSGLPGIADRHRRLKGVAALYPQFATIVARPDADARTLGDLDGGTVDVGDAGTRRGVSARQIARAVDADLEETSVADDGLGDALDAGDVDASIRVADWPIAAVAGLAPDVRVLGLADAVRQDLASNVDWFVASRLPAGVYEGVDYAVSTVAVQAVLVARESVPEVLVARTTEAVLENNDRFTRHASYLPTAERKQRAERGLPLELHDGANEYINF